MARRQRKTGILQIGVIVAALVILLAQVGFFDWLGRGARQMTFAVSSAIISAADTVAETVHSHFAKATAAQERDALRRDNQRLRYALSLARQVDIENRALRQLIDFHQSVPVTAVAWGRVIFRTSRTGIHSAMIRMPKSWHNRTNDGVLGRLPVIVGSAGLAGRIAKVEGRWGLMQALGDSGEVIDLWIPAYNLHGVGVGIGKGDQIALDEIPRGTHIPVGTRVVSGGNDGFFPAGLPVGEVTSTTVPDEGLYDKIVVRLIQPPSSLAEVMLLAGKGL